MLKKIRYNSPVILTFSLISLVALILGKLTNDWTTYNLFCVYRSSLASPLTYVRLFCHVFGHSGYEHYIGNITLMLVIGPTLEEKYGSKDLALGMLITAFISGAVQMIFFPNTALLGASGIVYMLIILSSLGGLEQGTIPLTLIFVAIFYIGGQIIDGIFVSDNVSQLTHVIGGICGGVFGYILSGKNGK
jgi:membrane associated rhomboid family serine protease